MSWRNSSGKRRNRDCSESAKWPSTLTGKRRRTWLVMCCKCTERSPCAFKSLDDENSCVLCLAVSPAANQTKECHPSGRRTPSSYRHALQGSNRVDFDPFIAAHIHCVFVDQTMYDVIVTGCLALLECA